MLRRSEVAALAITGLFLAVTAGYQLGLRHDPPEVRVSTASELLAETAAPARSLPAEATVAEPAAGAVNINTAGAEEFKALDGIGDVLAERIIAYRDEHGPFEHVEDITRVDGIGTAIFEKNRDRLTVG